MWDIKKQNKGTERTELNVKSDCRSETNRQVGWKWEVKERRPKGR